MNMIYTDNYCVRNYSCMNRSARFWARIADGILCAAGTMGVIVAMFFLLTL